MFLMVLFVVGMVSAISMPHAFYGEVYYSDGVLIQEELTITANIDDVEEAVVLDKECMTWLLNLKTTQQFIFTLKD